jgi:hypothetical protein
VTPAPAYASAGFFLFQAVANISQQILRIDAALVVKHCSRARDIWCRRRAHSPRALSPMVRGAFFARFAQGGLQTRPGAV